MNRKEFEPKMISEFKYITILDFEVGEVFQYETPTVLNELVTQQEDYEYYLTGLGHNLKNCEWMVHKNPEVITP